MSINEYSNGWILSKWLDLSTENLIHRRTDRQTHRDTHIILFHLLLKLLVALVGRFVCRLVSLSLLPFSILKPNM